MSKEDTSAGLLSKMVKFVRNPATSWTELDGKESDRDEAVSKQLLKEMIERKRRNDFVRKREFDMLRKMRKRDAMVGQDLGGQPSFFQSSMPSKPDDRAKTIKKIDEIEAQMSMQWWKTKQGTASSLQSVESSDFQMGDSELPVVPSSTDAPPRDPPLREPPPPTEFSAAYDATEAMELRPMSPTPIPASSNGASADADRQSEPLAPNKAPQLVPINPMAASAGRKDGKSSGFSYSNMMAVDVQEVAHDAELEEASISFANSDDATAEATLLEMLAPGGSRTTQSEVWMALFDFYRATDQQEKFETAALKFVQKFDRSAPQWFSMPAMVKQMAGAVVQAPVGNQTADWICSSTLGIQTVAALRAALARVPMPWRLNWSNLKAIEPSAVEPLCKVFADWSALPVQLRFMGESTFYDILKNATPSGDAAVSQDWWQLRMETLRVTNRADEFELVALDFCVTYEVSPPAWEVARCDYKGIDASGKVVSGNTIIGDVQHDSVPSGYTALEGDTIIEGLSAQMSHLSTVELSGLIEGDAVAMLEQLETKLMGADIMMISCARLIRVDFSAAGTLLNWVSARQAEKRAVHFSEVNRLVAAFFNVIGITEHAKVTTRVD
jgi:ABC-type transporter Mla MlaB component